MFHPHIPEVDIREDIDLIFGRAREAADESTIGSDGLYHRQVIIVTPGRLLIGKECPLPGEFPGGELEKLINLLPPSPPRSIAVIAYTYLEALKQDLLKAIPFFGFLMGFATIGHKVWVFEGHPTALTAGCHDADLLMVDGGLLLDLEKIGNWHEEVLKSMRGSEIKIVTREMS
ncbi:MAG: hypothetical protein FJZ98_01190 [Chloroflexi bacterium]|nr:hypothetical protein [Chloroflexota bacterium]